MNSQPLKRTAPRIYRICIAGSLGENVKQMLEPMAARSDGANTLLCGTLPDQAALYGLLLRLCNLGLTLISFDSEEMELE